MMNGSNISSIHNYLEKCEGLLRQRDRINCVSNAIIIAGVVLSAAAVVTAIAVNALFLLVIPAALILDVGMCCWLKKLNASVMKNILKAYQEPISTTQQWKIIAENCCRMINECRDIEIVKNEMGDLIFTLSSSVPGFPNLEGIIFPTVAEMDRLYRIKSIFDQLEHDERYLDDGCIRMPNDARYFIEGKDDEVPPQRLEEEFQRKLFLLQAINTHIKRYQQEPYQVNAISTLHSILALVQYTIIKDGFICDVMNPYDKSEQNRNMKQIVDLLHPKKEGRGWSISLRSNR
ncbi:MAG: hypothetical protein ACHQUC_01970 [Chlamydiales bacterium]